MTFAAPAPNAADIPSPPARSAPKTTAETAHLPLPPATNPTPASTESKERAADSSPPSTPAPSASPSPVVTPQPAPATSAPTATPAPRPTVPFQSPFATKAELQTIQAQLKALQELQNAASVASPEDPAQAATPATAPNSAASAPTLGSTSPTSTSAPSPNDDSAALQRRVEALEAELRKLQAASSNATPSPSAASEPALAVASQPSDASEGTAEEEEAEKDADSSHVGLLPLEFAAFGDFYYAITRPGADDFNIGAVEIDPTFHISPYVHVAAAIAYSGSDQSFSLPAFVVDCPLFGEGDDYPLQSPYVTRSGVSFGRFDVPFGVAYLEYPSVSNRLMQVPNAVNATHGSWNDLGVQGYAEAENWAAIFYVVNGSQFEGTLLDTTKPRVGVGGRVGAKLHNAVELGGSHARLFGFDGPLSFTGGDLSSTIGRVDLRGEYLLRHQVSEEAPDHTHGAYGRAVVDFAPYFLVGRYDTVFTARSLVDRRVSGGAAVEVFPQGEVRVIYEQSLNTSSRTVWLQLVGGTNFQPTGLRR